MMRLARIPHHRSGSAAFVNDQHWTYPKTMPEWLTNTWFDNESIKHFLRNWSSASAPAPTKVISITSRSRITMKADHGRSA